MKELSILTHGRAFANATQRNATQRKESEGVMSEELKKSIEVEGTIVEVKNASISKGPKDNRVFETVVSYKIDYTGFNLKELLILASRSVIIDLATCRNDKGATAYSVRKELNGKTFVWEDIKPTRKKTRAPASADEVGQLFIKKANAEERRKLMAELAALEAAEAAAEQAQDEQAQDDNEDDNE